MKEGALKCSFSLSLKVLPDSIIYSSSQSTWVHLNQHIIMLFSVVVSLSFGGNNRLQMVLQSLNVHCIPISLLVFLKLLHNP